MATLFEKGTQVFNRKYGAGKILEYNSNDNCYTVDFDSTDSDFRGLAIGEINSENLCLLSDAIKVGDRVHNFYYDYGTIKEIQEDEYRRTKCIIDFDKWLDLKSCTTKQCTNDGIMILKEFRDKKVYEPRLSSSVLLEELGEEEKINPKHLEELRNIILDTVKRWRKEYGYYKEIRCEKPCL